MSEEIPNEPLCFYKEPRAFMAPPALLLPQSGPPYVTRRYAETSVANSLRPPNLFVDERWNSSARRASSYPACQCSFEIAASPAISSAKNSATYRSSQLPFVSDVHKSYNSLVVLPVNKVFSYAQISHQKL